MGSLDDAGTLLALLVAAEIRAYIDPATAVNNRPCVLIGPPSSDYTGLSAISGRTRLYRLRCLSSAAAGDSRAWEELDALETSVVDVLNVETSEPMSYRISEDKPLIPCHTLTVRTTL